jgi:hypothetical protein
MPHLLPHAVDDINKQRVDMVAITGDLLCYQYHDTIGAETPAQGEKDLVFLADILDRLECPFVVIPGNHDREDIVFRVFGPFPEERRIEGCRIAGRRNADCRIICFRDSYVKGDFPGRVESERGRLEHVLDDGDPTPQIHLRHCVLWPREEPEESDGYRDHHRLATRIAESGKVRLVLSGHRHKGFLPVRAGDTFFSTAPGFCESPHVYWIYELGADGLAHREREIRPERPVTKEALAAEGRIGDEALGTYTGVERVPRSASEERLRRQEASPERRPPAHH